MKDEFTGNPWNEFAKKRKCLNTSGASRPGFHGDLQLIEIIESLLKTSSVFVETGSYHGCTSYYVAENFPNIQCYTCELDWDNYMTARSNLINTKNVVILNSNSIEFLNKITENNSMNKKSRPLFWLDAHGDNRNSGPILEEIDFIKNNFNDYIIFVDDVNTENVPTAEQFDLDYLSKAYDNYATYYVPTYDIKTGYSLTGWLLISSQDLGDLPHCKKFDF